MSFYFKPLLLISFTLSPLSSSLTRADEMNDYYKALKSSGAQDLKSIKSVKGPSYDSQAKAMQDQDAKKRSDEAAEEKRLAAIKDDDKDDGKDDDKPDPKSASKNSAPEKSAAKDHKGSDSPALKTGGARIQADDTPDDLDFSK